MFLISGVYSTLATKDSLTTLVTDTPFAFDAENVT